MGQTISGIVEDSITSDALPYVEVQVEGQSEVVRTDFNGRFSLSIHGFPAMVHFRYFNYKDTSVLINEPGNLFIKLSPKTSVFEEVVVTPKANPAYAIIRKVYMNRDKHNPLNKSFMYRSYNKFYFTYEIDSATLSVSSTDTNKNIFRQRLEDSYLFFTESVEERYYKNKVKDKVTVLSSRTSGFKKLQMALTAMEVQPLGFYNTKIDLGGLEYLNPVSKAGLDMYYLELKETSVKENDTTYTIYFRPRKQKFGGVKGMVVVQAPDYAIKYIEARPVIVADNEINIKIRQRCEKTNGIWFPRELNTTLYIKQALGKTVAAGRTRIDSLVFDPDFSQIAYNHIIKEYHPLNDTSLLVSSRDPLSKKEKSTYQFVDSLGVAHKFDEKIGMFKSLMNGRIPIKFMDLDLAKTFGFNEFEGFRLGAGLYTNHRISEFFSFGGYAGYGFKDQAWKYGSSLKLNLDQKSQMTLEMGWKRDIFLAGHTSFNSPVMQLYDTDQFMRLFRNRADYIESYYADFGFQYKHFRFNFSGSRRAHESSNEFAFRESFDEGVSVVRNNYNVTELSAEVKFLYNEKFVSFLGSQFSVGSNSPIIVGRYTRGLKLLDGEYDYHKVDFRANHALKLPRGGRFSYELRAGLISETVPLSLNYNVISSYSEFGLSIPFSLETMRRNEFFVQEYVSAGAMYDFRPFYKTKMSAPNLALSVNAIIGDVDDTDAYPGIDFKVPNNLYYEAGLRLHNVFVSSFSGIGIGMYYRLGKYSFDTHRENLAIKITFTLTA